MANWPKNVVFKTKYSDVLLCGVKPETVLLSSNFFLRFDISKPCKCGFLLFGFVCSLMKTIQRYYNIYRHFQSYVVSKPSA